MNVDIIFTRSCSPLSLLIRRVTREPVSHVGILLGGRWVIHSNLLGVGIDNLKSFLDSGSEIVFIHPTGLGADSILDALADTDTSLYDFLGLLYLGLRGLLPFLPSQNLWQVTGMYICTEWVTEVLDKHPDSNITPYQLYKQLQSA